MENARYVCHQCARVIGVTKGVSHSFAMAGRKFCTWCYNSLFLSVKKDAACVDPTAFLQRADPRFFEELIQKIQRDPSIVE